MADYLMRMFQKFEHREFDKITMEEIAGASDEIEIAIVLAESRVQSLKNDFEIFKRIINKVSGDK